MKVLVINSGSSSIKYQVFQMPESNVLAKGLIERIGESGANIKHEANGKKTVKETSIDNHQVGMGLIFDLLTDSEYGVVKSIDEISSVGHRVVHGGEGFTGSVLIDDNVIAKIEEYSELSPLHNPANLTGINACKELLKNTPMVACFDTGFHQTMPEHAYLYALPYEYYEKYKVRRYGFHGTSHKYVYNEACKKLGKDKANIITCHLGNGASVAAVKEGKCIDTSMGLTPLEGLIMGTRSGDIDPAIVPYIMEKLNCSSKEMSDILNKKSGLLGISQISNDMRTLIEESEKGHEKASLAIKMFCYRIRKYIGSYMVALEKTDAILFTGGIGENTSHVRKCITQGLEFYGIEVDDIKNSTPKESIFSKDSSKIKLMVINTDEELSIATDTYNICK